jgi:subtilisin family serine protease
MDKVNHNAIARRLLSLFLYLGVSVYLMMCSSDSRKSEDYYGGKMEDLGKARLSPKISAPQSIFGSEKIRDRGFEGVRGFIPDYAILAKDEIKLGGEFLVDGFVSLKGEYRGGNLEVGSVATNGSFKAEGESKVTGKLFLGPQGVYKIEGGAEVRGGIERLTQSIVIPDFESAFLRAKEYNDNEKIPSEFLKDGVLKLEGGKELELPSGVYYLKGIKLGGKSKLKFQGIAFVFLEGGEEKVKGDEKGKRNRKEKDKSNGKGQEQGEGEGRFCLSVQGESVVGVFPSELRVIAKCEVKVESKSKIYGFVASGGDVKVEGGGEIFGGVLAKKFKGEGKGKVHFDRALSSLWIKWGDGRRGLIASPRFQIITIPQDRDLEDISGDLSSKFRVFLLEDLVKLFIPNSIPTNMGGGIGKVLVVEVRNLGEIETLSEELDREFLFQSPVMFFASSIAFPTGLVAPQLVVTIKPGYDASEIFSDYGITEFHRITPLRYVVRLETKNAFEVFSVLEKILLDPRVHHADPDIITPVIFLQAKSEPNDPGYWGLIGGNPELQGRDQWYFRAVSAPEGWLFVYGGKINDIPVFTSVPAQFVAIVDTGVGSSEPPTRRYEALAHEDLRQILFYGHSRTGERTVARMGVLDPRDHPHGTAVAGVAGAHTNNSIGIAGIMWSSPRGDGIIPYDIGDGGGPGEVGLFTMDITDATSEGVVGINASWTLPELPEGGFTQEHLEGFAYPLYCGRGGSPDCDVIYFPETGTCQVIGTPGLGTILVFAAGNSSGCCEGQKDRCILERRPRSCPDVCQYISSFPAFPGGSTDQCVFFHSPYLPPSACYCPAGYFDQSGQFVMADFPIRFARQPCFDGRMIVVGATYGWIRANFSSVATYVTVSAPGAEILTAFLSVTQSNSTYQSVSTYIVANGTSLSAPLVTGLIGLISKLNPLLSAREMFDIVTSTAIDLGDSGRDNIFGYGIINVKRAIMKTLFYGRPLYNQISAPSSEILFVEDPPGTVKSTELVFSNQGTGTMYALITLESLSPSLLENVKLSMTLSTPTLDPRTMTTSSSVTTVEGSRAIVVLAPGNQVTIRLNFERVRDVSFDYTISLVIITNEGIEPEDLREFGGNLTFPLTTREDFGSYGVSHTYQIRVRTPSPENVIGALTESACILSCKLPLCIPIFCLPKAGCIYICLPPPGWATCPLCCLWCLFVFGDPGPGIPEEIPSEFADIMQSPECNLCSESLKSEGGSAFGKPECKLCIEKVVQRGASLSYQCDMCLMNIRDYGEQGADSSWCAICKDQWESMYEAYKDAVQSTMP